MSSTHSSATPYYFVPGESRHPVMAAIGLFFVILGAGQWINGHDWGKYSLAFGLVWWLTVLYQWFGDAIRESEGGLYGHKIDLSYRWSMSWFIFSEVMFFGAFFTALWWTRVHSVPSLGGLGNALRWAESLTTHDRDLYVESIGFAETYAFVRLIYEHHAMYVRVYPVVP